MPRHAVPQPPPLAYRNELRRYPLTQTESELGSVSSCQDSGYPDTQHLRANVIRPIKRCLDNIPTIARSLHPTFCTHAAIVSFILRLLFSARKTSALFVCDPLA